MKLYNETLKLKEGNIMKKTITLMTLVISSLLFMGTSAFGADEYNELSKITVIIDQNSNIFETGDIERFSFMKYTKDEDFGYNEERIYFAHAKQYETAYFDLHLDEQSILRIPFGSIEKPTGKVSFSMQTEKDNEQFFVDVFIRTESTGGYFSSEEITTINLKITKR